MATIEQFFLLESCENPSFIRGPLSRASDGSFGLVHRAFHSTPPVEETYRCGFMWRKKCVRLVWRLDDVIARIHELKKIHEPKKTRRAKGRT